MPFGVSVIFEEYEKIKSINFKKLIIALAGPMTNIIIAIISLLIHKQSMENIIYANLIIAMFNLLPIYPLDGGRILKCILKINFKPRKTDKIVNYFTNITLIILTIIASIVTLSIKNIAFSLIILYLWSMVLKENKKFRLKEHIYKIIENEQNKMD